MTPLPDWQRKFRDCAKMRDEAFERLEKAEAVVEAARLMDQAYRPYREDMVGDALEAIHVALTAYDEPSTGKVDLLAHEPVTERVASVDEPPTGEGGVT